jgi:hypothetical protein
VTSDDDAMAEPQPVGLELRVLDDAVLVDLDLQLHHVAARRSAHHAGGHAFLVFPERADVPGILVVIDDLVAICHVRLLDL